MPNRARRLAEIAMAVGSASPGDLATLWSNLAKERPGDYQLKHLVMMRWVELAPQQALEATLGSKDEFYTWRCWGPSPTTPTAPTSGLS